MLAPKMPLSNQMKRIGQTPVGVILVGTVEWEGIGVWQMVWA
jgi:hypothetical protein